MGTKISWADESWNPIVGCSKISAGCANCYAEKMAYRQACMGNMAYNKVVMQSRPKWTGKTVFVESALTKPLHWRKPRKIFVVSMGDLFHESVLYEWIDAIFGTMIHCNARRRALGEDPHIFNILTKRSKGMLKYYESKPWLRVSKYCEEKWGWLWGAGKLWHPEHVHLGVTVENPDNVWRIADLVRTPAASKFISLEPLLCGFDVDLTGIDYIYVGCESGPGARVCKSHAIKHMVRQGRNADVRVHVKQIPLNGKCNKNIKEWPKEFQVREV